MSPVQFLTCDGSAPVIPPATTAVAGEPGRFDPFGSTIPPDLAAMDPITPSPAERWEPGEFVRLGDGSEAWWDGDSWEEGRAEPDPCGAGSAPTISTVLPNPVSAGGLVRITGTNYDRPGLAVMVASVTATINLISATQVDVTIPPGTTPSNASIFLETECGSVNGNVVVT